MKSDWRMKHHVKVIIGKQVFHRPPLGLDFWGIVLHSVIKQINMVEQLGIIQYWINHHLSREGDHRKTCQSCISSTAGKYSCHFFHCNYCQWTGNHSFFHWLFCMYVGRLLVMLLVGIFHKQPSFGLGRKNWTLATYENIKIKMLVCKNIS